jgi:hypothetical protein
MRLRCQSLGSKGTELNRRRPIVNQLDLSNIGDGSETEAHAAPLVHT